MRSEADPRRAFECRQCGDCCQGYGGTFVSPEDIRAIAAYVKMSPEKFLRDCCQSSGGKPVLAQDASGRCMFWDRNCAIHPVKPRMCKAWPFIPGILTDVRNWRVMADVCPGINKDIDPRLLEHIVRDRLQTLGWDP